MIAGCKSFLQEWVNEHDNKMTCFIRHESDTGQIQGLVWIMRNGKIFSIVTQLDWTASALYKEGFSLSSLRGCQILPNQRVQWLQSAKVVSVFDKYEAHCGITKKSRVKVGVNFSSQMGTIKGWEVQK